MKPASHSLGSGPRIAGVVTPLVTPLTPTGACDHGGLEKLVERQVAAGVDAVFVLGSVGEGPLVTDEVYQQVARRAASSVAGRCRLLGGASDNSVDRCLARLDVLARCGLEAGVVTLPFYGWPGRVTDSIGFFATLAPRSPIPIVAYNLPKAVGWQMPVEALEELFQIPNLVCLKDTHGDFDKMAALAASPKRPAHFAYLPGNSLFAARLIRRGADGVVSTPSNLFPEIFVDLWRRCQAQQWEQVAQMDRELLPVIIGLLDLMPTGAASIKGLLELRGICSRHTMRPWPEAGEAELRVMGEALAKVEAAIAAFAHRPPSAANSAGENRE